MAKTIRQTVHFDAPPHAVFEALMDGERHAAFTGDAARIVRKIGGTFSTFGGYATGTTLKLEKDKLIVQSWRTTEFAKGDPDSRVMIRLSKRGEGRGLSSSKARCRTASLATSRRAGPSSTGPR